jgi:hypothetical protein
MVRLLEARSLDVALGATKLMRRSLSPPSNQERAVPLQKNERPLLLGAL